MNIDTPLRELGPIDTTALSEAILAQDDVAWKEDKYRQEEFEVHHATESIVVLFVDLDKWPDLVVSKEPGWPRIADQALPIMDEIIRKFYPAYGGIRCVEEIRQKKGVDITRAQVSGRANHIGIKRKVDPRVPRGTAELDAALAARDRWLGLVAKIRAIPLGTPHL